MALGGFCVAMLRQGHHGRVAARVPRRFRAAAFRPVPKPKARLGIEDEAFSNRGRSSGSQTTVLIAGGAAAVAANPADAFALSPSTVAGQMSDGSGNTASTAVWLQADTDKLIVAAPTQINMIVQADGTMTGPSAAATQIKNGSAFGIHVSKIQTTAKNGFALESTAKADDSASVTITPGAGTAVNLADTLSGWNTSSLTNASSMFSYCSRLSVNCSNWDVSKVTNHSNFNTNAPGVILPSAWQTSSDEGVEDSTIAPLCEEQGNRDALRVSDENGNDKAVSKTDGETSADSETEGSNTASATDEAGAKEETSDDIVQEETAAA